MQKNIFVLGICIATSAALFSFASAPPSDKLKTEQTAGTSASTGSTNHSGMNGTTKSTGSPSGAGSSSTGSAATGSDKPGNQSHTTGNMHPKTHKNSGNKTSKRENECTSASPNAITGGSK